MNNRHVVAFWNGTNHPCVWIFVPLDLSALLIPDAHPPTANARKKYT